MTVVAILVAAGRGSRLGGDHGPKQYRHIGGEPILARAARVFLVHPCVDHVQVVIHPDDQALYDAAIAELAAGNLLPPVFGGATRQDSTRAGLHAVANLGPERVLIHDAARPFVTPSEINDVLEALESHVGAIASLPVVDTLKREHENEPTLIDATVARTGLWRALTPQGFRFSEILRAHDLLSRRDDFTDDASIAEAAGISVTLIEGSAGNFKITTADDLARAEREVQMATEYRTGSGFDVHAFTNGDHVWLAGVKIPHEASLSGHSDADVAMHALTDAIYGALADGDIGAHFPPSDTQWKGAASHIFLEHARDRIAARGGKLINVDVTILCEAPKVGPHRDAMRERLAEILNIDIERVAVKATTTEQLGFTGRREGIAAMASATVRLEGCE